MGGSPAHAVIVGVDVIAPEIGGNVICKIVERDNRTDNDHRVGGEPAR